MSAAVMTHRFMNGTATDFFAPAGPMSSAILRIVICFSVHGYGPGRELDSATWAELLLSMQANEPRDKSDAIR